MSQVFLISDLHMNHRNVIKFEDNYRAKVLGVETIEQHDEKICDLWTDTVHKRDLVINLGDTGKLDLLKKLPGRKKILLGNHDKLHAKEYLEVFEDIIGPIKYKSFWLSHFPIHRDEFFGKKVLHGHSHSKGIANENYINLSIEMTGGYPISFQDITSGKYTTHNRVNLSFEEMIKVNQNN